MTFGHYLKKIRKDRGLSLTELSKLTGFSNPYLSQIERSNRKSIKISIQCLIALSESLDCPISDLINKIVEEYRNETE